MVFRSMFNNIIVVAAIKATEAAHKSKVFHLSAQRHTACKTVQA